MAWLTLIGILLGTYVLWMFLALRRNYNRALEIGLPILVMPVDMKNPIWPLLGENRFFYNLMVNLPFNLGYWVPYTRWSWPFKDKFKTHGKIGTAFTMVTPVENWVILADSKEVAHVLAKSKEFQKPLDMYQALNLFGRNLDTVEGDDWKRHRRLTAPSFNEKLSSVVWKEASRQGKQMLESWTGETDGLQQTQHDLASLALNVLTHAGFGMTYSFKDESLASGKHSMTYRTALMLVLQNLILLAVFSRKGLQWPFFSSKWRQIGLAADEFQSYMEEMVKKEKVKFEKQETESLSRPNLMSSLVRASEAMARLDGTTGDMARLGAMTDEEIFGNIFIYNLAGHETTANALTYATVLLAANPEVQEWVSEEIRSVVKDSKDLDNLDYETTFPKMKRCMAVLYETARTYPSVGSFPKKVSVPSATLSIANKTYTLPYETGIIINAAAAHNDPINWGSDATIWRPDRWILNSDTGEEKLFEPTPGSFLAWADGPRACPGKKIAQVEFVAVMIRLFQQHRVSPVLEGRSKKEVRQMLIDMAEDSTIFGPTLQMRRPNAVALKWTEAK